MGATNSFQSVSDRDLATLAIAGNAAAFDEIVVRHASHIRSLLRRMGAQPALADDLAQDAFLMAYERIGAFRNEGPVYAWIARIAARLYIRRLQRDARIDFVAEPGSIVDGNESHAPAEYEIIDLERALKILPATERICILLCHGVGLSNREAAEELKMPIGTIKSHINRGLTKLRAMLTTKITSEIENE